VVAGLLTAGLIVLSRPQTTTANSPNSGTSTVSSGTSTPGLGPIFSDPLTSNANGWADDQHCFFRSDGYHIKTTADGWECYAPTDVPGNFTAQVQVKQINGPTNIGFGIRFRRNGQGNDYGFDVDGYGHWAIFKCASGNCSPLSNWSPSGGNVLAGLNQENTLEVSASGSHFEFIANGKQIGQIYDPAYTSGGLGLDVAGPNVEAVFSNLVINQLV
jgi:hypothetical protein